MGRLRRGSRRCLGRAGGLKERIDIAVSVGLLFGGKHREWPEQRALPELFRPSRSAHGADRNCCESRPLLWRKTNRVDWTAGAPGAFQAEQECSWSGYKLL